MNKRIRKKRAKNRPNLKNAAAQMDPLQNQVQEEPKKTEKKKIPAKMEVRFDAALLQEEIRKGLEQVIRENEAAEKAEAAKKAETDSE
ncbi:MAG: hypothetical protein NC548_28985 [Lachnospiraceae bacterium]|nr:hypothetical protein [Lachnospiraceae bacterium]